MKIRNISRYQTTNIVKTWFPFLVFKTEKRDKNEFTTKFLGILVTITFM